MKKGGIYAAFFHSKLHNTTQVIKVKIHTELKTPKILVRSSL